MLERVGLTILGLPVFWGVFHVLGVLADQRSELVACGRRAEKRRQGRSSQELRLNVVYWLLGYLAFEPLTHATQGAVLGGMLATSVGMTVRIFAAHAIARQPVLVQAVELVVVADFLQYWWHRFMHTRWAWRYHAVHHSTVELNWLAAVRHHPLEGLVGSVLAAIPLIFMGFSTAVVVWWIPVSMFIDWLAHANLSWDFGPFRHVVASPAFHRWHHATEAEAIDKNFAQLFPVWDMAFGTRYFPRDRQPIQFGVVSNDVPETLVGQMLHPWRQAPSGLSQP